MSKMSIYTAYLLTRDKRRIESRRNRYTVAKQRMQSLTDRDKRRIESRRNRYTTRYVEDED